MKIRFNIEETIDKVYELDLVDSEKVIRRAEEMEQECNRSYYTKAFWLTCAVQELLRKDEICATLIDEESEDDITSTWTVDNEDS